MISLKFIGDSSLPALLQVGKERLLEAKFSWRSHASKSSGRAHWRKVRKRKVAARRRYGREWCPEAFLGEN